MSFRLSDYQFDLPEELVAQKPSGRRDGSRLMVVNRQSGEILHAGFKDIGEWLDPGDLLVANEAKVLPVRVFGNKESGGKIELLLLDPPKGDDGPGKYEITCLARPGKRLKEGTRLFIGQFIKALVLKKQTDGKVRLEFDFQESPVATLEKIGFTPLPPYIKRPDLAGQDDAFDRERYQTVYAKNSGAVAAPTAGLHFTLELLNELKKKGVDRAMLTLLVGFGTFQSVVSEDIRDHSLQAEHLVLPEAAVKKINLAAENNKAVTAVGTTTVRSLEFAAQSGLPLKPQEGPCGLFIYPGFKFKVVDRLLTNFHLPKSSLLMLTAAFAGLELVKEAYRAAVEKGYRFYSYGDAMLIL